MRVSRALAAALCLGCASFIGGTEPADAADHRDSPKIINDQAADLLDVYVFANPNNPNNVVLSLTVNPAQLPGLPSVGFSPDVLYQFKIDNNGDFKEDLVIQATFTDPGPAQQVTLTGPAKPPRVGASTKLLRRAPTATGPANGTTFVGGTATPVTRVAAGLFDDPFFFDLLRILRLIGAAPAVENDRPPGIDFYDTTNISAITLELPRTALLAQGGGNVINVWATTSRASGTGRSPKRDDDKDSSTFVQIERTAIPSENTVFVPRARKQEFNRIVPTDDVRLFRDQFIQSLVALNNDQAYSANLVDTVLLPDVLKFDVTSTAGFPNGRRFQDDVIDTALKLVTNDPAATDNVNANDVPFQADFPFIALPHSPTETIPGRD